MNNSNDNRNNTPIILLLGPTASGKTDLAMDLVKEIPAEIISVDSAMVYRGMDIGTGKPNAQQLCDAPHHLINIRDISEPYSAAEFCHDAIRLIHEIQSRNRIPLLVGGSMLYFRALLQGLSPLPSADPNIRAKLLSDAEKFGWKVMHDRLNVLDKEAALRIHPNDPQRIQRALEIYELTGQPQSALWGQPTQPLDNYPFSQHIFVILPEDRKLLHERISKRFHWMLEQGFMDEVQAIYRDIQSLELPLSLPALRAVGYRQALHYLAGDYTYDEMVDRAVASTRQLAKRQITWLRSLFRGEIHENKMNKMDEIIGKKQIHFLDLKNNHFDSLKSMIHCLP